VSWDAEQDAPPNRRHPLRFMSYCFYNIIGFGGRPLSAPVGELIRSA
jgi:hypothetical protein